MATDSKAPAVRSLTSGETALVADSLLLQAKSCDRAARASLNGVIATEHERMAAMCRNLAQHLRNGSLDI